MFGLEAEQKFKSTARCVTEEDSRFHLSLTVEMPVTKGSVCIYVCVCVCGVQGRRWGFTTHGRRTKRLGNLNIKSTQEETQGGQKRRLQGWDVSSGFRTHIVPPKRCRQKRPLVAALVSPPFRSPG